MKVFTLLSQLCQKFYLNETSAKFNFNKFYSDFIIKLSYVDDNMINIYIRAFIYTFYNIKKSSISNGINKKVFSNAIKEINKYFKDLEKEGNVVDNKKDCEIVEEEKESENAKEKMVDQEGEDRRKLICNLYKII